MSSFEDTSPKENPGTPLKVRSVVWCHVPRCDEDGALQPNRRKTPVFVNGIYRGEDKTIRSISAIYTCLAAGRDFDDPLVFTINNNHHKRIMGIDEDDRAVFLRSPRKIPFETRFFGDRPEITGTVPQHLWEAFSKCIRAYNEARTSKIRGSSVMTWSNLPPDDLRF